MNQKTNLIAVIISLLNNYELLIIFFMKCYSVLVPENSLRMRHSLRFYIGILNPLNLKITDC